MFPTDWTAFSEFFSAESIIPVSVFCAINAVLLFWASIKFLLVFQQGGYKNTRYFKWLLSPETPYLRRLMVLCLLGFLFFNVLNVSFAPIIGNDGITSYVGFLSYGLFTLLYINTESSVNAKVPLKKTKRLVRLSIMFVILLAAATFGLMILLNYVAFVIGDKTTALVRYSLICGMPILTPYILYLAYCVMEPFEWILRRHYLKIAKAKLDSYDVIKIGITGSYAKTSVKEILKTLLSQKYRVLSTPESYNTPLGIALTVKNLDGTHDVFLAEMGARSKGDIKTLAEMVNPSVGVLTGINNQHLETFGSEEAIKQTKYELFEYLEKTGGSGFFTADSEGSRELYDKFGGEKYFAGLAGRDDLVTAENVVTDKHGTTFTLKIKGEEPVECRTVLLGKHSVSNICMAAAVAYKTGLSPEEIALGISRQSAVKHRLELIPNNKNVVIIDDSYNANVDGIKAAMEVLDTFTGRKIVLTPGLVELGKMENVYNMEFGETLAKHADIVVIVGKHNAEMLLSGLSAGGMARENILFEKTATRGNETLNGILQEGDVVLFENDLPDNYN